MKVERVLQKWPLSKVELVSDGNEKFVRKSVHRDLGHEAVKQRAIYEVADGFSVPKILDVADKNGKTIIMMEYVEPIRETTAEDGDELIGKFHDATEPLANSGLFPQYGPAEVQHDLEIARQYGDLPEGLNADLFEEIFDNRTVLHGDWALDQIIIRDEDAAIIDFARSQVGPRILDQGHMLRFETDDFATCKDPQLLKAAIIADVQRMAWFDLCKRNYIDYSYAKEMKAGIAGINDALDRLGARQ